MKKKEVGFIFLVLALFCSVVIINTDGASSAENVKISERYLAENDRVHTALPENEIKEPVRPPFVGRSLNGFKEALGFKESRGNYFAVNSSGYMGKYQFGRPALKAVGVSDVKSFLENPGVQERAFIASLGRNKWILRREIEKYKGKVLYGVKVTESGILAAAHLAGPGNVKKYLRSRGNRNFSDANGASIRQYMKKFSGYDLSHIEPDKQAKI
ncbi:MAG: peptidoglycan-binding protein LysM [Sinomicrobium sp.]|nr:peptidoglycan-binding protein LysM [Sinomicrobium sp.]